MGLLRGLISRSFCHTLNIWKVSLPCGSSHNSLRGPILRSSCHTLSIWKASLPYVFACSFKWPAIEKLLLHFDHRKIILCGSSFCHTLNIWKAFLLFWSSHNYLKEVRFREALVTFWAFERLLPCVGPLMILQGTWCWKHLSHFVHFWIEFFLSGSSHGFSSNLM